MTKHSYQSAEELTSVVQFLLYANIAVAALQLTLAGVHALGGPVIGISLARIDMGLRLAAVVLLFATGVAFCWWMYRLNKNLRAMEVEGLQYAPEMAFLWCLVPCANLVMPYLMTRELELASHSSGGGVDKPPGSPLLTRWWLAWLLRMFVPMLPIGSIAPVTLLAIDALAFGVHALAALLAVRVVDYVQGLQSAKWMRIAPTEGPAGPPTTF